MASWLGRPPAEDLQSKQDWIHFVASCSVHGYGNRSLQYFQTFLTAPPVDGRSSSSHSSSRLTGSALKNSVMLAVLDAPESIKRGWQQEQRQLVLLCLLGMDYCRIPLQLPTFAATVSFCLIAACIVLQANYKVLFASLRGKRARSLH
jgi:hypothetical protein